MDAESPRAARMREEADISLWVIDLVRRRDADPNGQHLKALWNDAHASEFWATDLARGLDRAVEIIHELIGRSTPVAEYLDRFETAVRFESITAPPIGLGD